jgi:hypothetical protein
MEVPSKFPQHYHTAQKKLHKQSKKNTKLTNQNHIH